MTSSKPYIGRAHMSDDGRDVLAFHLHRYVSTWLEKEHLSRVVVTVGFEASVAQSASFEASLGRCEAIDVAWTFADLCHIYRGGDGRLRVGHGREADPATVYELVPLLDAADGDDDDAQVLLGFALIDGGAVMMPDTLDQLAAQATEAIRAARRNAMRLFFDDHKSLPAKAFLYKLMDHLPEWTGSDHSASVLMTSNLEAMTLDASDTASFDFLAERLFYPDDPDAPRRLVGMSVAQGDDTDGLLQHAVAAQANQPDKAFHVFTRDGQAPDAWVAADGGAAGLNGVHRCEDRRDESMYVLVPMLADEEGESEHLGFVVLIGRSRRTLAKSTACLLEELGQNLTSMLRDSPLFSLNARKLWILSQTRALLEAAITEAGDEPHGQLEALIGEVTELIVDHVDVPSFAIAYLSQHQDEPHQGDGNGAGAKRDDGHGADGRSLRYAHPHGWTHFEQLNLPVDVPVSDRADSGVSSLAVRINRPLVLAGGHGAGEQLAFKNDLYVHEGRGVVVDARSRRADAMEPTDGWVRLSQYYKPARSSAYATLAFPIAFGGTPLGVISVEVERDTNWLWWTGFGAQLFWGLLASELAYAFRAIGVDPAR